MDEAYNDLKRKYSEIDNVFENEFSDVKNSFPEEFFYFKKQNKLCMSYVLENKKLTDELKIKKQKIDDLTDELSKAVDKIGDLEYENNHLIEAYNNYQEQKKHFNETIEHFENKFNDQNSLMNALKTSHKIDMNNKNLEIEILKNKNMILQEKARTFEEVKEEEVKEEELNCEELF